MFLEILFITLILSLTFVGSISAKVIKIKNELDEERIKVFKLESRADQGLLKLNQIRNSQKIIEIAKKYPTYQNQKTC